MPDGLGIPGIEHGKLVVARGQAVENELAASVGAGVARDVTRVELDYDIGFRCADRRGEAGIVPLKRSARIWQ